MPPDVAVEVVSPGNRLAKIMKKVAEYLEVGVALVWVVYPKRRQVVIYRAKRRRDIVSPRKRRHREPPRAARISLHRERLLRVSPRRPHHFAMTDTSASATTRTPRWPWVVLGLGLVWTVLLRVPLILNAEDHLDSDLAVDGLTLIDALHGQWRWHYPGTPHMGILPLFFSYPQALIWGANAFTLVSGGTLIWLLIVTGTFWLAWKAYGPSVAGWAILPLVFSSTGTIWLSGRITGGHLLTLAWHTLAFVGLHACLEQGRQRCALCAGPLVRAGALSRYDVSVHVSRAGSGSARRLVFRREMAIETGHGRGVSWSAGIVGFLPHEIGRIVDPYDAYPSQFIATFEEPAVREHGRLLALQCLPRLIAGTELDRFDRIGRGHESIFGKLIGCLLDVRTFSELPPKQEWLAVVLLIAFVAATIRVLLDSMFSRDACGKAISFGTSWSALWIVGAFLVNRNIFNSDNYRYLIYLLTPWSLGFGLLIEDLRSRRRPARAAAIFAVVALFVGMTARSVNWYQDKLHYMSDNWRVLMVPCDSWSEPRRWRTEGDVYHEEADSDGLLHRYPAQEGFLKYKVPSDVTHVFGDYWDVYRMTFLSGKKVAGVPYPIYPNRFPAWSRGLGGGKGRLLVLGLRSPTGRESVLKSGDRFLTIHELYDPKSLIYWRPPFAAVWQNDGRDPAELYQIRSVVPSFDSAGR